MHISMPFEIFRFQFSDGKSKGSDVRNADSEADFNFDMSVKT